MRALSTALFAAALPLAACASTAAAPPEDVAAVRSPPAECEAFAADRVQLTAIPNVARQGETLGLWAYVRQGPYAPKEVPLACLDRWTVNPAGAAVVSSDGTRLTIAADAPAGEILTVTARAAGNFTYLTTAIVGRDDIVLTGRWRQTAVDCPAGASPAMRFRSSSSIPSAAIRSPTCRSRPTRTIGAGPGSTRRAAA